MQKPSIYCIKNTNLINIALTKITPNTQKTFSGTSWLKLGTSYNLKLTLEAQ